MNKKILMLLAACVVLAVFLSAVVLYDRVLEHNLQEQLATTQGFVMPTTTEAPPTTKPGDEAPAFTLTNADGEQLSSNSLIGKPVVMMFWASWSTDSTVSLSYIEELYKTRGDEIHVLAINVADGTKETRETAEAFLADKNFTCPIYFDDGTVAAKYKSENPPMTFFLNDKGIAKVYIAGALYQDGIDESLAIVMEDAA